MQFSYCWICNYAVYTYPVAAASACPLQSFASPALLAWLPVLWKIERIWQCFSSNWYAVVKTFCCKAVGLIDLTYCGTFVVFLQVPDLHPLFSQQGAHLSQHIVDVSWTCLLAVRSICQVSSPGFGFISEWEYLIVMLLRGAERAEQQQQWKIQCCLHFQSGGLHMQFSFVSQP